MHPLACIALALSSFTSIAGAQGYIADPLDNPRSTTGNAVPLSSSMPVDESRCHFFFPAAYLPGTGGLITAIDFAPPGFGGELWLPSLSFLLDGGALNGAGSSSFAAAIPTGPTLIGLGAHFQSLILGASFDFTNAVEGPIAAY